MIPAIVFLAPFSPRRTLLFLERVTFATEEACFLFQVVVPWMPIIFWFSQGFLRVIMNTINIMRVVIRAV